MRTLLTFTALLCAGGLAAAEPKVVLTPRVVHPGDAVLVTVTGMPPASAPEGSAADTPLPFFAARGGFQAVVAVPLDFPRDLMPVKVAGAKETVKVAAAEFPETSLVVEDELASPTREERERIDADNHAIVEAARTKGDPQFTRPFLRPPGKVTSTFGEWRTFNDGHRSQHLGMDVAAREGSKVRAMNAGTVTLVRDCFLAGNAVVITHGGGIASTYYHLQKALVTEGQTVARGAAIGLAGHTGRATGPHLHVSIRVAGGFVDPDSFFKLRIAPRRPAARSAR